MVRNTPPGQLMLQLDDPSRPVDASAIAAPGGFTWWYADLLDAQGSGLVCIWSYGLPFLPGERAARLAGRPAAPSDRPSLNLALYERGRATWYTLLTLPPERAIWKGDTWQFGDSHFSLTSEADGRATLRAQLDLPVPGDTVRLQGGFSITGPRVRVPSPTSAATDHAWAPVLGPSTGTASLRLGEVGFLDVSGSGYHDRNASHTALDELGIDHWTWGRQVVGDTLVIHYLTWPERPGAEPVLVVVLVGPDGNTRVHDHVRVELIGPRRTWLGMRWWERIEVDVGGDRLSLTYAPPVDDGPFYLRAQTQVRWRGQEAHGWAELCEPRRIDLARHRPLIAMCVQPEQAQASMWLPLFVGPRHDRVRRLLRHWRGERALLPDGAS